MKIIKEFVFRTIAGDSILVPTGKTSQEINGMITLSPTAAFIWEHVEHVDNFDELTHMITEEFDVDEETARHDAFLFISELIKQNYLQPTKEDMSW